ncbi:MAG: hypothetical protein KC912_25330 [Proteobacteria bacterium]|nr:hypothetical protein [Pseudomonadota bacterium]
MLDTGAVKNAAAIAQREELTRARVSQLLRLLKLAPEILAQLEDEAGAGPVPPEKALRKLAGLPKVDQHQGFRDLIEAERFQVAVGGRGGSSRSRVQRRGLQHQFERARRFQRMLDDGEVSSLKELGLRDGLTGGRVAQLLNLLHLSPEIIKAVDVPVVEVPTGVTERKLRAIARLHDVDEQAWAFRRLTGGC